jgi:hypothetical protein
MGVVVVMVMVLCGTLRFDNYIDVDISTQSTGCLRIHID